MATATTKKEVVVYSNELNDIALSGFCAVELDLFMTLCSKVKDKGTKVISIKFSELRKTLELSHKGDKYIFDQLESVANKLSMIRGSFNNGKTFASFTLFTTFFASLDDVEHATLGHVEKSTLVIRVNEDFGFLLNEITKRFTKFELQEFISLQSKYAKNLYRLLKQWKTEGVYDTTKKGSLEEFKPLIGGEDYKNAELYRYCIQTAVKELVEKDCFKNLKVETVRGSGRGRPVAGYIFTFDKEIIAKTTDSTSSGASKGYSSPNKNKFNNFAGRNYDDSFFNELERKKLAE